ncbi:MAG: PilZ domain-containing protein [Clostridia bacterium]|nr:PilZ domain-containing protein [Clostridia bacterium]
MANNKIIIGKQKEKDEAGRKEIKPSPIEAIIDNSIVDSNDEHLPEQLPLDKKVWGNDNIVLNKLDENQLVNRRLYVRVRHIQQIECDTVYEEMGAEPTVLDKPIIFTIIDLSAGGIGIMCEHELNKGTIFAFRIKLDDIVYDIKCEVVYCFQNEGTFRAGLKMAEKNKLFYRHLKIYVARISLQGTYGHTASN